MGEAAACFALSSCIAGWWVSSKWVLLTPGWGGGSLALIGNWEMLEWREDGFPGTRMEN